MLFCMKATAKVAFNSTKCSKELRFFPFSKMQTFASVKAKWTNDIKSMTNNKIPKFLIISEAVQFCLKSVQFCLNRCSYNHFFVLLCQYEKNHIPLFSINIAHYCGLYRQEKHRLQWQGLQVAGDGYALHPKTGIEHVRLRACEGTDDY